MYALLEVHVTRARQLIDSHEAGTGEAISFTGHLRSTPASSGCRGRLDPSLPARRRHLAIFDDVDVFLPVERQEHGATVAVPHIIRRADHKELLEIHREIRAAQSASVPEGGGLPKRIPLEDASTALLPVLVITCAHSRFMLGRMIPAASTPCPASEPKTRHTKTTNRRPRFRPSHRSRIRALPTPTHVAMTG